MGRSSLDPKEILSPVRLSEKTFDNARGRVLITREIFVFIMTKKFYESLVDYFSYAEKLDCTWQQVINTLERPIESLKNQSQQLRHVNSTAVDHAEVCQMLLARDRLCFKINAGIDNDIALIAHGVHTCRNLYQDLRNKFNNLERIRAEIPESDLSMPDLVKGTGTRPQLSLLLVLVKEMHKYYSDFYNTINQSFILLNRNDEETIEKFVYSLEVNEIDQLKVRKILATIQFL